MKLLCALLLMLVSVGFGQDALTIEFAGTAINETNADKPVAAEVHFTVSSSGCTLKVMPPLTGSGPCRIKGYDEKTGDIDIVSDGPPSIVWSGTVKGNFASGSYKIDVGAQKGDFYMAVTKRPATGSDSAPPRAPTPGILPRSSCVPAVESAITGEVHGWDGETIFKLDNGQIWQQAEYDYTYFYEYHPDVTIYETSGGCRMKVEDEDETLIVKRIK